MSKYFVFFAILCQVFFVRCCEKPTFVDCEIKASRYFTLNDVPGDIKFENKFTGCLTETDQLKGAIQILIKNQNVPVLYEEAVNNFGLLHTLRLNENGIQEIKPGAFKNLPEISVINLALNDIQEIPEGVFNYLSVKRLFLNKNNISSISATAFDNMPNLERIDLDHNNLKNWNPDWFTNSPKLYFLSAAYNQIIELPALAFKNFQGKHVGITGAPIYTNIQLDNNKISKIDEKAFSGLKELQYLYLGVNEIQEIPDDTFKGFEKIEFLILNKNKLTCLSEKLLNNLQATELVDVDENPLDCGCVNDMKIWARSHTVNLQMRVRKIECMQQRIRNTLDSVKDIQ